jgi:flagellar hook-length control protein FliK
VNLPEKAENFLQESPVHSELLDALHWLQASLQETPAEIEKTSLKACIQDIKNILNYEQPKNPEQVEIAEDVVEQVVEQVAKQAKEPEQIEGAEDEKYFQFLLHILAIEFEIPQEDRAEFYSFATDLLKQDFLTFQDFVKSTEASSEVSSISLRKLYFDYITETEVEDEDEENLKISISKEPKISESEKETSSAFFMVTLESLWHSVKNGDEPKKEELLYVLKQIADTREMGSKLRNILNVEQNLEPALRPEDSDEEAEAEDFIRNFAYLGKRAEIKHKIKEERLAQPDIRAAEPKETKEIKEPKEARQQAQPAQQQTQQLAQPEIRATMATAETKEIKEPKETKELKGLPKETTVPKEFKETKEERRTQPEIRAMEIKEPKEARPQTQQPQPTQQTQPEIRATVATAATKQQPVQPEIRAVWEANGLKIEVVNPKTGEKLQSTQAPMPSNMQGRIQEFEVVRQVVERARFITTPTGEQRMTVQLRPEHLGQVDMRISLNHGEMQIHARVESVTAQAALENHIGLLREGLEKQGITLDRLEVSVEQREKQDANALAHERENQHDGRKNGKRKRGRDMHLAVGVDKNNANADTGRRLGYNTMEYLA